MIYLILILLFVVIPVGVFIASRSFGTVKAGTEVVLFRFGAHVGELQPGLHSRTPGVEQWLPVKMGAFMKPLASRSIAHDGLEIGVRATVHMHVISAPLYARHKGVFETNFTSIFGSAANELIGQHDHDEVLLKREQFRDQLRFTIDQRLERFGLTVDEVYLDAIQPDFQAALLRGISSRFGMQSEVALAQAALHKRLQALETETRVDALRLINEVAKTLHPNTLQLAQMDVLRRGTDHQMLMNPDLWAPPTVWAAPQLV
jgi:regulator of protease activity HflC (stomatin/prohibitin superfamily)